MSDFRGVNSILAKMSDFGSVKFGKNWDFKNVNFAKNE